MASEWVCYETPVSLIRAVYLNLSDNTGKHVIRVRTCVLHDRGVDCPIHHHSVCVVKEWRIPTVYGCNVKNIIKKRNQPFKR